MAKLILVLPPQYAVQCWGSFLLVLCLKGRWIADKYWTSVISNHTRNKKKKPHQNQKYVKWFNSKTTDQNVPIGMVLTNVPKEGKPCMQITNSLVTNMVNGQQIWV